MRQFPDRNGPDLDVDDVFSDAAFAGLKAGDAAFVVVRPDTCEVLWANAAAARFFHAAEPTLMAETLFGPRERSGGWLHGLARGVVPGRPPRLARGGLSRGLRMQAHTALIRSIVEPEGSTVLAFAVPETCGLGGDPENWRRQAWAAVPAVAETDPNPPQDPEKGSEALDGEPFDAGLTLARRSQLAILRDRLNHGLDGAATPRLLWQTDETDRVTRIDSEPLSRLGARIAFREGGFFPDMVEAFDGRAGAQLRAALASRRTWSGIELDLPVAEGVARLPMSLSGSPVLGPGRLFAGFRGFGTIDLARLDLAPPKQAEAVAPTQVSATSEPGSASALPDEAEVGVSDEGSPALRGATTSGSPEPPAVEPVPAPPPANVVHLRTFQALASGRLGASFGDRGAAAPLSRTPPESPVVFETVPPGPQTEAPQDDDLAFQALGEALRARIGGLRRTDEAPHGEAWHEPEPSSEAGPLVPDCTPETAGRDGEDHDEASHADRPATDTVPEDGGPPKEAETHADIPSLLSDIPLPLLVTVGSTPVFANQRAANLLGHASLADLAEAGYGQPVFAEPGRAVLQDAQAGQVTFEASPATLSWNGSPAFLWISAIAAPSFSDGKQPSEPPGAEDPGEVGAGELLDRVDDAVALLDGNGFVRRLNRLGELWFAGARGQSFTQLLASESRSDALALFNDVRAQRDGLGAPPLRCDVQARTGQGAPVPMIFTLGRLGTSGFYLTLRDVSALRRAETERASVEHPPLRDADRLPALLGKVSHEIRTPLNAILGFAEVMMDERFGPLGNPRYKDYLKDIHNSGTQVMTLVEDLLDLSRIEAGQLDLSVEPLDVNRIVAETVAQMQPEAHRERVIMRTSLGGRVPAVLADERSARQIVRNLLSNAVRFNEPGGQVIVSTASSDSGTVLLRVRDTGVGMTDDEIAAALEPFGGRVPPHAGQSNGAGSGLGLPLTRALVGVNGASMAISSRPREGTLVEVAFTSAGSANERRPA